MLCLLSKILPHVEIQVNSRILCVPGLTHGRCFPQNHYIANVKHCQLERFMSGSVKLKEDGFAKRLKKKVSGLFADKTKVNLSGILVYEKCADDIDYKQFFDYFALPDTFQSYFLAVELHVWMCTIVGIKEKHGRMFRNSVVEAMWNDIQLRLEELKNEIPSSERKKYLSEMTDQFQAALISYDEGILSEDTVLAASVWRTLFSFRNVHPTLLENAVLYIRKQLLHLDSLNTEDFIKHGCVTFLSINNIVQDCKD